MTNPIGPTFGGNVDNVLYLRKEDDRRKLASKVDNAKRKKRVSTRQDGEAEMAGDVVISKFKDLLLNADEVELLGYVIDGQTSDERSDDEDENMETLFSILGGNETQQSSKFPPVFEDVVFEMENLESDGEKIRVLTTFRVDDRIRILISQNLGMRDAIIAAHEGYSDYVAILAKYLGIPLTRGDLGKQISELVSSGKLPTHDPSNDGPSAVEVYIDGVAVSGIPR